MGSGSRRDGTPRPPGRPGGLPGGSRRRNGRNGRSGAGDGIIAAAPAVVADRLPAIACLVPTRGLGTDAAASRLPGPMIVGPACRAQLSDAIAPSLPATP